MEFENNAYFWQKMDLLYLSNDLVITHKKGDSHPKYSNLIYPVDYGYLNSKAEDDYDRIDTFKGTGYSGNIQAIVVCADILRKDIEVKLIVDCTAEEERIILEFLNQTDFQKTIICRRGLNTPDWAMSN